MIFALIISACIIEIARTLRFVVAHYPQVIHAVQTCLEVLSFLFALVLESVVRKSLQIEMGIFSRLMSHRVSDAMVEVEIVIFNLILVGVCLMLWSHFFVPY